MDLPSIITANQKAIIENAVDILHHSSACHYCAQTKEENTHRIQILVNYLVALLTERNPNLIDEYCKNLAKTRFQEGYELKEVQAAINSLQESLWSFLMEQAKDNQFPEAVGLCHTSLGRIKDVLAQEYVQLASQSKVQTIDLAALNQVFAA